VNWREATAKRTRALREFSFIISLVLVFAS
jgi:hypothetical protein